MGRRIRGFERKREKNVGELDYAHLGGQVVWLFVEWLLLNR